MNRILALAYGVASYLAFLAAFLYAVGFVGNLLVPKSIDSGPTGSLPASALIDTLLLLLFAVPHSVMARPAFKRWWTRFVPPPVERSTYVLVSSLTLGLLFWQWRPMPGLVWDVTSPVGRWLLLAVFWLGWAIVLLSTFLINHFDLFGLRQVFLYFSGRPYTPVEFRTPLLLSLCPTPHHARVSPRLLGDPDDDPRASAVCRRDNRLHPHRPATRRAGFGRLPRRAVPGISEADRDAPAAPEASQAVAATPAAPKRASGRLRARDAGRSLGAVGVVDMSIPRPFPSRPSTG